MASIILSSVGTSIGNSILPGVGGRLMSSLGRKIGRGIDQDIGWSNAPSDGARLENFKVQDSRYGLAIPLTFGQARMAGNVIWTSDLIETSHETSVGGGKGGVVGDAFNQTRTTYTYSLNCAIALGEGEIGGVQTIWADSKVIYQNGVWSSGVVGSATLHTGAQDQAVDPLLESWIGEGLTPAYHGVAYLVLQGLQLGKFGNRLPNMTFEIMPRVVSGEPQWLGQVDGELMHNVVTNRQGGMAPIIVDGGAVSARQMIVGGFVSDGATGQLVAVTYDVTGSEPVELRRAYSASFDCEDVGDHSWAMAPDGRFVAMGLQDGSSGLPYYLTIYDTLTHTFGPVLRTDMLNMELRQIAWLDAQHFVVNDYRGTSRGVRVYMRSGAAVVDCGFHDVWGAGSSGNRVAVGYTQFRAHGDGLLTFMGDRALNFTALYARYLCWSNNALTVGNAFAVSSGYSVGSGSGPQVTLHKTGEDEWTLFYLTLIDLQMMSFVPSLTGVTITRPWQKLTSEVFTASASNVPVVIGDRVVIVHRPTTESAYRLSEILLAEGAFERVSDALLVQDVVSSSSYFNAVRINATRLMVLGNVGFEGWLGQVGILKRHETGDTLANVVAKLLRRAGYGEADYDVSALQDTMVEGYTISAQATAASALEQLMLLRPFDLVETEGQLKAVLHGAGDEVAVPTSEASASVEGGAEPAPTMMQSRRQELDLPLELGVDYLDAARDYEIGSQRARRYASRGAVSKATLDLPIVVSAGAAKQIAQRHLYAVWIERDQYRLVVSRAWVGVEPSDIVVFDGHRMRVTSVTMMDGLVQIDGVAAVPSDLEGTGLADTSGGNGASLPVPVATTLYLMDLPLLRNEDDQAGVYAAVSGIDGWKGATLWRAADGVNFTNHASFPAAATAGIAASVLGDQSSHYMDRVSTVQVQLLRGSLSSCTQADLLNGSNVALCGAEIVQFQTAVLLGPNLYELRDFLRGRKGTEGETANHQIGESFVLLSPASLQFLPAQMTDRGSGYHFRAVSNGGSLDFARDTPFVYTHRTLASLAPAHVRGERVGGAGSDLTIGWIRRARKNAQWVDYIDVPLDETTELYDVEIIKDGAAVRTFANVAQTSVTYTAAQQVEDWGGSVPSAFTVKVMQLSATYGRGSAATQLI